MQKHEVRCMSERAPHLMLHLAGVAAPRRARWRRRSARAARDSYSSGGQTMSVQYGRIARALLLAGGITTAVALPAIAGTPLMPSMGGAGANVVLAAPALDNDNNGDESNDNSQERNIEGQILEINEDSNPPEALVGMVGGNVWARLYNDQLNRTGINNGDYVKMQGEYSDHGIFDAYDVNVVDRWGGDDNDND